MADFCFRSRICLGSVVSADRAVTILPRRLMCGNFLNWATKTSCIFQLSYSQVSSSFISEIHVASFLLGDHTFLTCHLIQWCLKPNHVSYCDCKINNTYILLFQDLDSCYLWQILYSTTALICQHFKINKTLEMEWLCAHPVCQSQTDQIIFITT